MPNQSFEFRPFNAASVEHYRKLICDPSVTRHMPLAEADYSDEWIQNWIAQKSAIWPQESVGPWSVWVNGAFAGWSGFEPDEQDLSFGVVLHKEFWGYGRAIFSRAIELWADALDSRRIFFEFPLSRSSEVWAERYGLVLVGEIEFSGHKFMRYALPVENFRA